MGRKSAIAPAMPDQLLSPEDVAEQLVTTVGALAQLRYTGRGPKYLKLSGKTVRYRQSDITAWLDSVTQQTTR